MSDGDPSPAPLPWESESSLRTRRVVVWTLRDEPRVDEGR
ncbi:hypothetical protein QFZ21_003662 [Microbacterium sp. W4I20]|nr:hypothetical protein [Microbacterium sp. W4I20]